MNEYIKKLSNKDIKWQGIYAGFTPIFEVRDIEIPEILNDENVSVLISMLSDKNTFVLAHVLLTKLSGIEYQIFPQWNNLAVDIRPDGEVVIDPEQRFKLAEQWRGWYLSQPKAK